MSTTTPKTESSRNGSMAPEDVNIPQQKIVYIFDESMAQATTNISHLGNRATMVHDLMRAYNLLSYMDNRPSKPADIQDLLTFHSNAYVDFLTQTDADDNNQEQVSNCLPQRSDINANADISDDFGLGYDCPVFKNMKEFACIITGGTLSAVEAIIQGSKIAINWCGGWHHAQRNEASGFCYVNDIVIGIQVLLKHFEKVLYVDLDAHHGDGVENAFSYSKKVMTLSMHNYEVGYFPGTGNVEDVGFGRGKYFSVNVPLQNGVTDSQFISVFERIFSLVEDKFDGDVYVIQMGTDCLSGDPLGTFNLTEKSLGYCAKRILRRNIPVIFLGGGGYKLTNAAKAWTYITSVLIGVELSNDIPEHKYFADYGPDFTLDIPRGLRKNENTLQSLTDIQNTIAGNLQKIVSSKLQK